MSTAAQINANQLNAQLSTGPRTPEGIANCKYNATKHGLSGAQIVIKGENPADYDAARAAFFTQYAPEGVVEEILVDRLAVSSWKLQRAERVEATLTNSLGETAIYDDDEARKKFSAFLRHRNSIARANREALAELRRLQAPRLEARREQEAREAAKQREQQARTAAAARSQAPMKFMREQAGAGDPLPISNIGSVLHSGENATVAAPPAPRTQAA